MEFKELTAELEKFKDTEDYKSYIGGLPMTADRVNTFLETEDGKKYIQPILDKYHSKGLETWKTNNLSKLIDEEIKKKYPDEDPKSLEIKKLQAEFESMKREAARKDLANKTLKIATEKGLPVEMIDFLIGEDEDATNANLSTFEKVFNSKLSAGIEAKLKDKSYIPPNSEGDQLTGVEKAFYDKNPSLKTSN